MELNKIYNEDCQEGIKRIPAASVDCILTDPPYLYLKKQKLERPFDEPALFAEFKRILKPTGFVVLFGRGTSFYRWNTLLAELGFIFREEIVWDKGYSTSPLLPISRTHETISLFANGKGKINKARVPYLEMKRYNVESVISDIKRMRAVFGNSASFKAVEDYLLSDCLKLDVERKSKENGYTISSPIMTQDRAAAVARAMDQGLIEKTIIKEVGNRYKIIHPTQKPVRLLERLLALVTAPGNVVLDPFAGSCSTAIACVNSNRQFIGFEIDKEYYDAGAARLANTLNQTKQAI